MSSVAPADPEKLTKKQLKADHPTWCPGCGDFTVLACFFKILEELQFPHENICTIAGIGCSSRFPYFVNSHGLHFIHGRALPLATGVSLSRPDLHVFAFGGDGDGFSIGGNHLEHCARKNPNLTYVIMDNFVYGLTKKQTSPTSPIGFQSKTDPSGAMDTPVNPMKKLVASGASFIARTHSTQVKHMTEMFRRAIQHPGFSVIEVLSECPVFYKGAFDDGNPRKGGEFEIIDEKVDDGTPEDNERHDVASETAAFALADIQYPGKFGVFYQKERPSKNALEDNLIKTSREKSNNADARKLIEERFKGMR
ncbi:MAG: pyruvate ferredoxin oxidoreductase [Akkermansiaceae bacterium]|jgi:2-oxoglutarate/2-oxoacid ferredoxin oxidoreductase subunit beta|nr:pyruvate ferredoxin oxidoreductase [Akkermansiaceae bacterium]MDG1853482.1 thiamine pyrophosphate-dependent enzyme [Verrucomicrobiales bacterium]